MIKLITSVGERVLGTVLPQREVRADSCTQSTRCMRCWSKFGTTWQKRWCCTSQYGTECTAWQTYIHCEPLTTC